MIRRIIVVSLIVGLGLVMWLEGHEPLFVSMLPALLIIGICYGDYCVWKKSNEKIVADIEYEYKCKMLDNLSYVERLAKAKSDFWWN